MRSRIFCDCRRRYLSLSKPNLFIFGSPVSLNKQSKNATTLKYPDDIKTPLIFPYQQYHIGQPASIARPVPEHDFFSFVGTFFNFPSQTACNACNRSRCIPTAGTFRRFHTVCLSRMRFPLNMKQRSRTHREKTSCSPHAI